jgi:hypothetical protein
VRRVQHYLRGGEMGDVLNDPIDVLVARIATYLPPEDGPQLALAELTLIARASDAEAVKQLRERITMYVQGTSYAAADANEQRAIVAEAEAERWKGAMRTLYRALDVSGQGIPDGVEFPE